MKNFRRIIQINDNNGVYRDAVALLDTQCDGNWISNRLIKRLGLENLIVDCATTENHITPSGSLLPSATIKPTWKFKSGVSVQDEYEFFVFKDTRESDYYDVLIGRQYIVKGGLLTINNDKFVSVLSQHEVTKLCKSYRFALELNVKF
jgi:hypothetical protein